MKVTYDSVPEIVSQILSTAERIEKLLQQKQNVRVKPQLRTSRDRNSRKAGLHSGVNPSQEILSKGSNDKILKETEESQAVPNPDRITIREAVKLLVLKPSRVNYIIKSRHLPVIALEGNRSYYSRKQLSAAVAEEKDVKTAK